ncbi:ATP synthase subunit I [Actibacterium sp. MT2.3-13A]|uniref:N-ATPase subunit AtpR n=1 Tax=Actibacterium sp. MT2.3-13A TaxID=2828332 RepID=UPI001BA5D272|nr:ATP synthase subunit I [Actibacterium sp. MT2.3-13A]
MTDNLTLFAGLALALIAGAAFGALYLRMLWRGTRRLAAGEASPAKLALSFALRMGLALAALALALMAGAGAGHLLAAALGFTLMRHVLVRRVKRRGEVHGHQP